TGARTGLPAGRVVGGPVVAGHVVFRRFVVRPLNAAVGGQHVLPWSGSRRGRGTPGHVERADRGSNAVTISRSPPSPGDAGGAGGTRGDGGRGRTEGEAGKLVRRRAEKGLPGHVENVGAAATDGWSGTRRAPG